MRIVPLTAAGDAPGWLYKHRATLAEPNLIRVWGGKVVTGVGRDESHRPNSGAFELDVERLTWRRLKSSGS